MLSCCSRQTPVERRRREIERTLNRVGGVEGARKLLAELQGSEFSNADEYLPGRVVLIDGPTPDFVDQVAFHMAPQWKEQNVQVLPRGFEPTHEQLMQMVGDGQVVLYHGLSADAEAEFVETYNPIRVFLYASPSQVVSISSSPEHALQRLQSYSQRMAGNQTQENFKEYQVVNRSEINDLTEMMADHVPQDAEFQTVMQNLRTSLNLDVNARVAAQPRTLHHLLVPVSEVHRLRDIVQVEDLEASEFFFSSIMSFVNKAKSAVSKFVPPGLLKKGMSFLKKIPGAKNIMNTVTGVVNKFGGVDGIMKTVGGIAGAVGIGGVAGAASAGDASAPSGDTTGAATPTPTPAQ